MSNFEFNIKSLKNPYAVFEGCLQSLKYDLIIYGLSCPLCF